jgi:UDP-2-acetamido-3-amino-2,3-dideoxy-glucuronate N-acetyltransferase
MEILNQETAYHCLKNVKVGSGTRIFQFVNAYQCELGDDCKVGAFVEIQKGVKIGHRCKVSSHSFLCEGVTLENDIFIGHSVTFINDRLPRASADGALQTEADWVLETTTVKSGASIGSGSTILCGITIGEGAMVGAGAVVTKDVEPYTLVVGNPARKLRDLPRP